MRVFEIDCEGERHKIILNNNGQLIFKSHSKEEFTRLKIMEAMGSGCGCTRFLKYWRAASKSRIDIHKLDSLCNDAYLYINDYFGVGSHIYKKYRRHKPVKSKPDTLLEISQLTTTIASKEVADALIKEMKHRGWKTELSYQRGEKCKVKFKVKGARTYVLIRSSYNSGIKRVVTECDMSYRSDVYGASMNSIYQDQNKKINITRLAELMEINRFKNIHKEKMSLHTEANRMANRIVTKYINVCMARNIGLTAAIYMNKKETDIKLTIGLHAKNEMQANRLLSSILREYTRVVKK